MKLLTYKNLTAFKLRIINQDELTKDPNMSWNISYVDLIIVTGVQCLRRGTLEFQHHFMGKNMEVLFGDDESSFKIMD